MNNDRAGDFRLLSQTILWKPGVANHTIEDLSPDRAWGVWSVGAGCANFSLPYNGGGPRATKNITAHGKMVSKG